MSPETTAALGAIAVAVVTSSASLYVSLTNRPKMSAEAKAADASGEVALSGDARAWVQEFRQQASEANTKAEAAEDRVDELEDKLSRLERAVVAYTHAMHEVIVGLGGRPPAPPDDLIPPLSRQGG